MNKKTNKYLAEKAKNFFYYFMLKKKTTKNIRVKKMFKKKINRQEKGSSRRF